MIFETILYSAAAFFIAAYFFYVIKVQKNTSQKNNVIMERQEEALHKMDETNRLLAEIRDSLKAEKTNTD